jgi:hypothetical protein
MVKHQKECLSGDGEIFRNHLLLLRPMIYCKHMICEQPDLELEISDYFELSYCLLSPRRVLCFTKAKR